MKLSNQPGKSAEKGISQEFYNLVFVLIGLTYLAGSIFIRLMDVDASQYASISMEMLQTGNLLEVYHRGYDYLDKPPFLFWSAVFFYKILGVGEFSYRLSSLLFLGLGAFSSFKLAEKLFDRNTAFLAAVFVLTNQATFLMGHDVRTDTILTGSVIFSIWQIYEFNQNKKFINLLLAALGIAISMMEKGPIGLVVPALAFFPAWVLERDWKSIFRWQWFPLLVLVAVFLIPMSIGLYQQFDLHPEKMVNGRTGVSGLRFFFWEQSFGRITGENVWKDDSTVLFFTHTFLWAFLPWMFLAIGAFVEWLADWIRSFQGNKAPRNNFLYTGFILTFISFSLSQFKLPHYINVIFPLAAIFTADYTVRIAKKAEREWRILFGFQQVVNVLLVLVILAVVLVFFPMKNPLVWIAFVGLVMIGGSMLRKNQGELMRLVGPSLFLILAANLILNVHFYPNLLVYQPGSSAAKFIIEQEIDPNSIRKISLSGHEDYHMHCLDFYIQTLVPYVSPKDENGLTNKNHVFFTDLEGKKLLEEKNPNLMELKEFDQFNVTQLNFIFLFPETRDGQLGKRYLIKAF